MISPGTYFSRHAQALLSALGRLIRQPLGTVLTIFVIVIALALPSTLWLLVKNARIAAGDVTDSIELSVFFKTDVPLAKAEQLAEAARQRPGVEEVTLISADEALEEFRQYSGFGAALDALQGNPLPHVITLRPDVAYANPQGVESLKRYLSAWPEVETVQFDGEWVRRLTAILDLLRNVFAVFAIVLGVGVLAVVGNAIRLEIRARRSEIEVTKLVGGTNAFVRRPFLYEGVIFGLLGGAAAVGIVSLAVASLIEPVGRLASLYGGRYALVGIEPLEALVLISGGTLLGVLGAWLGAARLIARIEARG
ncbi:MAG: cell division protein FtsX [Gammaproteobacteria bacterium]|nr:cell division protein FtsX [Gammaproteobacteria bacterium]